METSEYLESKRLRNFTIPLIARRTDIPLLERLSQAVHYEVSDWLLPAVSFVVSEASTDDISMEFAASLGVCAYFLVARGREEVKKLRQEIANNTPFESSWQCPTDFGRECEMAWQLEWYKLARYLTDPNDSLVWRGEKALQEIEQLDEVEGMCSKCLRETKTLIRDRNPWSGEEAIARNTVKKLAELFSQNRDKSNFH